MRKRIISPIQTEIETLDSNWLELEGIAEVEITSEDVDHPIEAALLTDRGPGWRAANPGKQTIRLLFEKPQRLRRIRLNFEESQIERTQEYVLRWSPDGGRTYLEVVRQQWSFSPQGATCEKEDHQVDLDGVTVLELSITPDIGESDTYASMARLQLA